MKKKSCAITLCCIGMSCFGQTQTAQVQIAGTNYPVTFADTNLSSVVRQRIASDLTIVFSLAPSFERLGKGKGGAVTAEDVALGMAGFLTPASSISMFPTDEKKEGIFIVEQNNARSVHINQVASSNYLHTFALMKAHSNAVQKAHEFVALVSNPNLLEQPAQVLKKMYHTPPLGPDEDPLSDEDFRGFLETLQQGEILKLSAINFSLQKRPEANNTKVLVTMLYTFHKPDMLVGFPILFHDGRWGFGKLPFH